MPSLPGVVFVQFGELWNANWRMTEQMRDSSVRSAQLRSDNAHFCEGKFFVSDRAKDKTDASSLCVAQLDASDVFRRLYFVSRYTHCICMFWPTLLAIAISTVQTWLYNNLATGQGESCDTCKRVQSLPAATRRCSSCRCSGGTGHTASVRAGRQFFDKLIVWLNSNLPRLCAQLSRASYQQKCVHKLTCSLQEEETRGEPAMPMLGQINLSCVCTLTFAANQQRANERTYDMLHELHEGTNLQRCNDVFCSIEAFDWGATSTLSRALLVSESGRSHATKTKWCHSTCFSYSFLFFICVESCSCCNVASNLCVHSLHWPQLTVRKERSPSSSLSSSSTVIWAFGGLCHWLRINNPIIKNLRFS